MIPTLIACTLFAATLVAEPQPELLPPAMTREQIKAARAKADTDAKLDTKRPWDSMFPNRTNPTSPPQPKATPGGFL